jgi:hypothetical protein
MNFTDALGAQASLSSLLAYRMCSEKTLVNIQGAHYAFSRPSEDEGILRNSNPRTRRLK